MFPYLEQVSEIRYFSHSQPFQFLILWNICVQVSYRYGFPLAIGTLLCVGVVYIFVFRVFPILSILKIVSPCFVFIKYL